MAASPAPLAHGEFSHGPCASGGGVRDRSHHIFLRGISAYAFANDDTIGVHGLLDLAGDCSSGQSM